MACLNLGDLTGLKKIDGVNVANLGPYIKQKYRDITYFRGIDFHQDIIDYPQENQI